MTPPSLSVIIPAYNQAHWLRQCLASVRRSGVDVLEVIVVDDGSTDDSRSIVAAEFPEVRYLWQPNSGNPSRPRNEGFAASSGRYVSFLDADDQWIPGAPAKAVALLDRHPEIGVLFADALFGNPTTGYLSWAKRPTLDSFWKLPRRELELGFVAFNRSQLFRQLMTCNVMLTGSTMIRREVFAATGGFDPGYWGGEDWEVWLRLSISRDFGFWDEPMSRYTSHENNITRNVERMRGGFCQAIRNVLAKGDLTPADRRFARRRLREQLYGHAYMAYDRGDLSEAKKRFSLAIRSGDWHPVTVALAAMCLIPPKLVAWFRRRKEGLGI